MARSTPDTPPLPESRAKGAPNYRDRSRGSRPDDAGAASIMPGREFGAGGGKVDGPAGAGGRSPGKGAGRE